MFLVEKYIEELVETLRRRGSEAREVLRTRVGAIKLEPKGEGPNRHYVATGAFSLLVPIPAGLEINVAGAGFEPATFGL